MVDYSMENLPVQPRPFKSKEAKGFLAGLAREKQRLQQKILLEPKKKGDYEKKIKSIDEMGAKFTLLVNEVYAKCKKDPPKLHFRLNMALDEQHEVTLLQSFEPKNPTAPAADSAPEP